MDKAFCRGGRIRTDDLTDPNGARYQPAPRPECNSMNYRTSGQNCQTSLMVSVLQFGLQEAVN